MVFLGVLHGPWLPGAALLLATVVVWRGKRSSAQCAELWLMAAMTVCALLARGVWGLWGPLHINGQGPLWIRGALEHGELMNYGPGYFELFSRVARLGGAPDRAVFAANALLSAASPALLYATARLAGISQGGALAAATVLAADAVSVRTAATEGYFSSLILLVLGVQVSLLLSVRARVAGDRPAAVLSVGAACLLAAAAARIHPVGYLPLALAPFVVLASARPPAWHLRIAYALGTGAAIGATVLLTSGEAVTTALRTAPTLGYGFAGSGARTGELLLAFLVLVLVCSRWVRPPWMPVVAVLSLLVMLATRGAFAQHPLWERCYERLFFPGLLLGAAPLLPRPLQDWRWALGGAAIVAAALLVLSLPHLRTQTTEQREYAFLRETLGNLPPDCTLASVSRAGKRIWNIPSYLLPGHGPDGMRDLTVEHPADLRDKPVSGDCLIYVRASLCTSAEARALCESVEHETRLERIASRAFPAVPSYVELPYDRPDVEVAVFRVLEPRTAPAPEQHAAGAGAAITPVFAQSLCDRVTPLRAADGCRVQRLDTNRFSITVGVQGPSGEEHTLSLAHEPDRSEATRRVGAWALAPSAGLEHECGLTVAAIERVLWDLDPPAPLGGAGPEDRRRAAYAGCILLVATGVLLALAERSRNW